MSGQTMEVSCANCTGACCSDVRLPLTDKEARRLTDAGTRLHTILSPLTLAFSLEEGDLTDMMMSWSDQECIDAIEERRLASKSDEGRDFWHKIIKSATTMNPGEGLYIIDGSCGLLDENGKCSDYENRPSICKNFEVAGEQCITIRDNREVPVNLVVKHEK